MPILYRLLCPPVSCSAVLCAVLALASCGPGEPTSLGAPPEVRRLTEEQYRNSIADIFGADIKIAGRFDPVPRTHGLIAVGTSSATVTPAGFEQLDGAARFIAHQVLDPKRRGRIMPCTPADPTKLDEHCAAAFLAKYGRLLLRRALAEDELHRTIDDANAATKVAGDFYTGLEFALAGLLVSPDFIFRRETVGAVGQDGSEHLDGNSMATRLSYFLWNTTPDEELLRAADAGELANRKGLARQVDRMLASPRLEQGVRAFFRDFLQFEIFDTLDKDSVIYPKFSQALTSDEEEQLLRTIVDQLVTRRGDYRDLFTTRRTFINRRLGMVYRVRVDTDGWEPYEFTEGDHRGGLTTLIGFTAMHSHPGRSSATLRGKAIRELLLCEKVPDPPANVNFAVVQDTSNPNFKTARERLTAHRNDPTCSGCHKMIDPIGLALENFDGLGQYRSTENGAPIDTSGELDGMRFADAAGLGQILHNSLAAASCVTNSLYRYAVGRDVTPGEAQWAKYLVRSFAVDRYRFTDLMRRIATSDAFYSVAPAAVVAATKEASK